MAYPQRTYAYTPATAAIRAAQPTTAASALIRPAQFNHTRALLPQYATYVGYDIAEVVAQRAVDLIQSCREEYTRTLFQGGE